MTFDIVPDREPVTPPPTPLVADTDPLTETFVTVEPDAVEPMAPPVCCPPETDTDVSVASDTEPEALTFPTRPP